MKREFKDIFENLKNTKFESDDISKQERGHIFEKLMLDVLEEEDAVCIIKRSYHTADNRSEQIDGAIRVNNRVMLIEIKWQESNMAASSLYSFFGKIENKFLGTIGVFISRTRLSENFIQALNKGRRQCVIVLHDSDIDAIFNSENKITEYIDYAIEQLSIDNRLHVPFTEFEEKVKLEKSTQTNASGTTIIADIFNKDTDSVAIIQRASADTPENADAFKLLINNSKIIYRKIKTDDDEEKLKAFLENYFSFTSRKAENVELFINKYLQVDGESFLYVSIFTNAILAHYSEVSERKRRELEQELADRLNKRLGDYYYENYLTEIISVIWNYIQQKQPYFNAYIDIYLSTRSDKFPNKQFAYTILSKTENVQDYIAVWLREIFPKFRIMYDDETREQVVKIIVSRSSPLAAFAKMNKEEWTNFVVDAISSL